MKGTINAALPKAKERLLNDPKEFSESAMMLDLMRNDLGAISTEVKVESFRYIQKVAQLYQTSSHISAKLKKGISFDEIFSSLLPAGSKLIGQRVISMLAHHRVFFQVIITYRLLISI